MATTTAKIQDQVAKLPAEVQSRLEDVRDEIESVDVQIRRVVREHPFMTAFGALASGYLLGRLIARR